MWGLSIPLFVEPGKNQVRCHLGNVINLIIPVNPK